VLLPVHEIQSRNGSLGNVLSTVVVVVVVIEVIVAVRILSQANLQRIADYENDNDNDNDNDFSLIPDALPSGHMR
jgi:hypothetical protein